MRIYCFKCNKCGEKFENIEPVFNWEYCFTCHTSDSIVRDYKAESIGFNMDTLRSARQ